MWDKMKVLFTAAGKMLWPLIEKLLTDEGQLLIQSATGAIVQVSTDPTKVTWQDKLTAAVGIVEKEMATKGLAIATTDIINAVQVAYTDMKAQSAQALPPTTPNSP